MPHIEHPLCMLLIS